MKSKSSIIIIIVIIAAVAGGVYYFFFNKSTTDTTVSSKVSSLVSTNTGTKQGLVTPGVQPGSAAGNQVVQILRNLSAIQLDDTLFQNPSFALLQDISIALPPITNQGRRNPFAPVGVDNGAAISAITNSPTSASSATIGASTDTIPAIPGTGN